MSRRSSTRNPFDSSDDESGSPVRASSSKPALNPFDDDANFASQHRASGVPNHHHNVKNPFSDDEGDEDYGVLGEPHTMRPHQGKEVHDDGLNRLGKAEEQDRRPSQFRARISASGDAALKSAQKIKDAGTYQASKLVDGSISQVHKMKESTFSAFKSSNGQANPRKSTLDVKNEAREELFDSRPSTTNGTRVRYDDSQFQQQDLEYKSMEELEGFALQKSEETTLEVQNCLHVAEEIKGDATKTLLSLHEQGEQIRRTHETALDIDQNLGRGEKLLGSLGGMFSKTWKPQKSRPISGPAISKSDSFKRRGHHLQQRVALGLNKSNSKGRPSRVPLAANRQQTTQDKLEVEKAKQDDALSVLSDVLDDLKIMSQDMGAEIASQNVSLDGLDTDIGTLKDRVQGANYRARRLLGR